MTQFVSKDKVEDSDVRRIAIIGIGCRFPGGITDVASYWSLLTRGRTAIREVPPDRWSLDGFYDPEPDRPDRSYARWGGFLDDIKGFDASFFGISPRDAEAMDPQQRLLLQVACEAARDARLTVAALRAARCGVFAGVSTIDYGLMQRDRAGRGDIQAGTGTALSIVANRVSNRLDLSGPSLGVDTACSSSIVALDTACRHLDDGTCDMALAAGVNILLDPRMFITFSRAHMLSPTGRIRAFDADADGFVRGEGVGVVLLRRLEDAVASGDRIYATIEATAVNQDGRTGTITEPSRDAQIAMLRTAIDRAGVGPADIDYVEAHGTGTPVGDPIEATAIGTVLGGRNRDRPLPIGSAKTNLGHLEPAAGIAGLIKAALTLHHRAIPPSLGFERPNPAIAFDDMRLMVPTSMVPLVVDGRPARALVNSFGFGGTNACAVLNSFTSPLAGEVPRPAAAGRRGRGGGGDAAQDVRIDVAPIPVPLSAPTSRHLQAFARALADAIESGTLATAPLAEITAALAVQCDSHEHRAVVIATNSAELVDRLRCLSEGRDWPQAERHAPPQIIRGTARTKPRICFTMTGQGGQWWAMGREHFDRSPAFRETFETFDAIFKPIGGWSPIEELLADEARSRIDDAAITPAVMFAFQTGLANVWRARGVVPDIVLGHSFGEVTAAYLAGGLDMPAIARLVDQRGLIRHRVDRVGTMAAIGMSADAIAPLLPPDGSIEIGGYNSPDMVTLTGEEAAIDRLIAKLNADDQTILTRKLALDFAYHSSWFEPVEAIFHDSVGALDTKPAHLPVISTVTGELNTDFSTSYWWSNLRYPVRYSQAVETALAMNADIFVELGPHRTLSSMTTACAAGKGRNVVTITTIDKRWGDLVSLAVATGQLWTAGIDVDWLAVTGCDRATARALALPAMPWLEQPLWLEPDEALEMREPGTLHPLLGRRQHGPAHAWLGEVSLATHGWLGDHRLDGTSVLPAAAYLEMLSAAARDALGCIAVELVDVIFPAALYVGTDDEHQLATRVDPGRRRIEIHSRPRGAGPDWVLRAAATAFAIDGAPPAVAQPDPSLSLTEASPVDVATFYADAKAAGYGWGPSFQGLIDIRRVEGAARGIIEIAEPSARDGFHLDPRVTDSALQLMLASGEAGSLLGVMPTGIARIFIGASPGLACVAHGRTVRRQSGDGILADIDIATPTGTTCVTIRGLEARRRYDAGNRLDPVTASLHVDVVEPIELVDRSHPVRSWKILTHPACRIGPRLAEALAARAAACRVIEMEPGPLGASRASAVFDNATTSAPDGIGIIDLRPLAVEVASPADIAQTARRVSRDMIDLGRHLASHEDVRAGTPLVVVTRRARTAHPDEPLDIAGLAQAPALAAARTIAMELPHLTLQLIDGDEAALADVARLARLLDGGTSETEVIMRSGDVLVPRLETIDRAPPLPPRLVHDRERRLDYAVRHDGPVGPDGLHWQVVALAPLGDNDVDVEIAAVGLNFRDVMAVSGLLPPGAERQPPLESLGLEFSGRVSRVGKNVRDLAAGDQVFGMAPGALRRRLVVSRHAVCRVSDATCPAAAATLPSVFMTALYALGQVARLERGETVLIHSAAGGFGLAAIQLAQNIGARIIATAGTPERRSHLRSIGIEHVFDSRNASFADDVMRATNGRGVDVVLNSLSGPLIDKGLACLAPYGRFLELGKRDIYANAALGLKSLRSNISLHVIDVAALITDRPDRAAKLLRDVAHLLEAGEIGPLPARVFAARDVADAFRHFAADVHIGKVVVDMTGPPPAVRSVLSSGGALDAQGTYLVTGGTRGFGLTVGRWLAQMGAGRVVLASRGGATSMNEDENFETVRLDVTSAPDVMKLIERLVHDGRPLRGIVHAAVAYDDAMLGQMDAARIDRVVAPKVDGAMNLTQAVLGCRASLDFFVTFSSLAQVVGWPGQSNYAAANGFLEALAAWQRTRGIPGQCINWGALGESGQVARSAGMQSYLDSSGWIAMSDRTALAALAHALDQDVPSITIAHADWSRLAATHPAIARSSRLMRLRDRAAGDARGRRGLAQLSGPALENAALELVRSQVARVLRTSIDDIRSGQALAEAGIDSLSSFELHNRIEQEAGLPLAMTRFVRARTVGELASLVAELANAAGRPATGPDPQKD